MSGRLYQLHVDADGVVTVRWRPDGRVLVDQGARVAFDLSEPPSSPRNRAAIADVRQRAGTMLPVWLVRDAVDQARLGRAA